MNKIEELQQKIGYSFQDEKILKLALVHASRSQKKEGEGIINNERLEFLGDRVLGLVMADILYHKFPTEAEGVLSRRHAAMVRQKTLSEVGRGLNLGEALLLSRGEKSQGGPQKASIISDAVEALIAALYLDGGFAVARQFVETFCAPYIETVRLRDSKSALQEKLQSQKLPLPTYSVVEVKGQAHQPIHVVKVVAEELGEAVGEAASKKEAEQVAAENLLAQNGEKL